MQLEEKCFQANKTCTDLLTYMRALDCDYKNQVDIMKQKHSNRVTKMTNRHEKEAETLKSYILDIKGRFPDYVPMRKDEIDLALAEFVNNFPDKQKLKLMFIR